MRALEGIRKSRAQSIVIESAETRSLILRIAMFVVSILANWGVEVNAELKCMGAAASDSEPQEQDCLGIHIRSENEKQYHQLLKRDPYRASALEGCLSLSNLRTALFQAHPELGSNTPKPWPRRLIPKNNSNSTTPQKTIIYCPQLTQALQTTHRQYHVSPMSV